MPRGEEKKEEEIEFDFSLESKHSDEQVVDKIPLIHACKAHDIDLYNIQSMLDEGHDPNEHDSAGSTPLIHLAWHGSIDAMKLLIQYGADVNISNLRHNSALHFCFEKGYYEAAKLLLVNGASKMLNSKNTLGKTPISLAHNSKMKSLIDFKPTKDDVARYEMEVNIVYQPKKNAAVVKKASKKEAPSKKKGYHVEPRYHIKDLSNASEEFVTKFTDEAKKEKVDTHPLIHACKSNDLSLKMIKKLLDDGANVNDKDSAGSTPLIHLSWRGNVDAMKMLIEAGADVTACNLRHNSALHFCFEKGHYSAAKLLLINGAKPLMKSKNLMGKTPLTLARKPDMKALVNYKPTSREITEYKVNEFILNN